MIVTVINKTTGTSFSVQGEFNTLSDIYDKIEGTDNERTLPYSCKVINKTNNRTTISRHDRLEGGDEVELHVYPVKIDAGA